MSRYPKELFDGEERDPWVISGEEKLTGTHQGSIYVQRGAGFVLAGTHQGSLTVEEGGAVEITGTHQDRFMSRAAEESGSMGASRDR
jgi:hypothetical protein